MSDNPTFDTNILVYAFAQQNDDRKKVAKEILAQCNIISLQVINECSFVLMKKFLQRKVNRHFCPSEIPQHLDQAY